MPRSSGEYGQNNTNKRGIVVDRDPKKMRVKVKFSDEDETVTTWVDVLAASAGTVKTFMMPNEGDEVWCSMDAKGEDGCVMGSKYNDQDTPPTDDVTHGMMTGPFGTVRTDGTNIFIEGATNVVIKAAADLVLEAGGEIITNQGGELTNNGKNIGHDHKHKDVTKGPDTSGEPE